MAVVVTDRCRGRRRGPAVAGVLAPLRPGTHLPAVRTGPRLDRRSADPEAADRWTWLVVAAHTPAQARPPAARRTSPCPGNVPHPAHSPRPRFRRNSNIHATMPCPAGAPEPTKPGPGQPPESKNRRPAPRHDGARPRDGPAASKPDANAQVKVESSLRPSHSRFSLLIAPSPGVSEVGGFRWCRAA